MSDPASTLPEVSPHEGASKMQPQHAVIDDTHPHRKEEGTQIGAEQLSPGSRPDSAETRSHVKEEASKAAPTTMKPKPCSITDTSRARKMDDTKPKESPTTHHPSRVSNLMSTSWIPDGIETASFRDTISALEKYTAIMTIGNTTGQITEPNDPRIPPKVAALAELIQEFTHSHPKAVSDARIPKDKTDR